MSAAEPAYRRPPVSAERLKAFTDAVVAIAMTLLILPLMESISEAAREQLNTLEWLTSEFPQLFSFVLSFALIANFWISNHRLFDRIEQVTSALVWLSMAWMLTIVWLPVATGLLGQLDIDPLQKLLYIGSLLTTSLIMLAIRVYVRRHPDLHTIDADRLRGGVIAEVATSVLFTTALVVAVAVPAIGYWAMFILLLTGPITSALARRANRGDRSPR